MVRHRQLGEDHRYLDVLGHLHPDVRVHLRLGDLDRLGDRVHQHLGEVHLDLLDVGVEALRLDLVLVQLILHRHDVARMGCYLAVEFERRHLGQMGCYLAVGYAASRPGLGVLVPLARMVQLKIQRLWEQLASLLLELNRKVK